ncbi:MAG: glycoside hydrolase family 3 C-terminal domain-containing protein, partial [Hydrogenibacillus sp.]|nr:glycoside hydrolase family 3 C-terminal domain-containing protein [Hydrogenibacillus sp.]
KIGQLMMVGFHGKTPSQEILDLIENDYVGGVILFGRNIGTSEELYALNVSLQEAARRAGQPYPLLISTDQENGVVRRLGEGTTLFPGNMFLGAVDDPEATAAVARATGRELKALGVNMNLAPVIDVNNNPANPVIGIRSFGERPELVARHGVAAVKGYQEAGVVPTIKHFPGHGDTDVDSHLALPTIAHDLERLEAIELVPFRQAIAAGADCVMTAHIDFPALESHRGVPATISRAVVTDFLRDTLGFSGVVITDCLEMKAIADTVGTVEGALQALIAGNDLLLISHTYALQKEAIQRIAQAVESGEIPEALVDQAVLRVLRLKAKYTAWETAIPSNRAALNMVGSSEHAALSNDLYARGVTLVKNEGIIPLKLDPSALLMVVYPGGGVFSMVEDRRYTTDALKEAVLSHHDNVTVMTYSPEPTDEEMEAIADTAANAAAILIGTMNAHLHQKQAEIVRRLIALGKPVIVIAMRNPYDLMAFPDVGAFLAAYEFTSPALSAAVQICFGQLSPCGKLPVTIPGMAAAGFGLSR